MGSMLLSFAGNPNFVNKYRLYTFNIDFMHENLNFFIFTMKKFTSTFCNVSFAGQYILLCN